MLEPITTPDWTLDDTAHLLNRAGFGARPEQLGEWHALGRAGAVEKLLAGGEPAALAARPEWFKLEAHRDEMIQRRDERMAVMAMATGEADQKARMRFLKAMGQDRQRMAEAAGWWSARMTHTGAPLVEKMTLFWHGHFATSVEKVKDPFLMLQQNELFREQALGNLKTLAKAVSRDPAMMVYLDMDESLKTKPNENFAREVMELFTLGEGHYTEADIKQAARAFTGYKVNRLLGRFFFHAPSWDDGEKEFFGEKGAFNGDDIIDRIFAKPQCAKYLAQKIWTFFVAENPPSPLVEALAATLRDGHYELKPFLRTILLSAEFYAPANRRTQIKSPVQFLVGSRHALGLEHLPPPLELGILQQLGQSLFRPPNVAGWDGGRAWINTNTLLARYNIAGFLIKGPSSGYRPPMLARRPAQAPKNDRPARMAERLGRDVAVDFATLVPAAARTDKAAVVRSLARRLFQADLDPKDLKTFDEFVARQPEGALSEAALADLLHLMMSTPLYQLC
jgi:uncharacterized protein (DUF1800 family)